MDSTAIQSAAATPANAHNIVPPAERRLNGLDIAFLWFGAAIAITEIWAGGLAPLTGLGLGLGLIAIVLGRVIGNGLMAAMGHIGAATGLPGIMLSRLALGVAGSRLLGGLNVLQLIGWTGWMLFVGFLYCDVLAASVGLPVAAQQPAMRFIWVGGLAALCTIWAVGGERLWKPVQHVSSVLLAVLCAGMTFIVLRTYDVAALLSEPGGSFAGLLSGVDIVVAMSVSWVPLVADYSRYAVSPAAGRIGTFWGYFVGGTWMYATGLLVALAAQTDAPDQMVVQIMAQAGYAWALLAVVLVLASTVTTTFLDIFSTVVSAQEIVPHFPLKLGSLAVGCLGAACALWLDVFKYQHFLEAIGLVFLPAFSIVICDYFLVRKGNSDFAKELLSSRRMANWAGLVAWLAGALVYDRARGWASIDTLLMVFGRESIATGPFETGASLPCILASAGLYFLLSRSSDSSLQSENIV